MSLMFELCFVVARV